MTIEEIIAMLTALLDNAEATTEEMAAGIASAVEALQGLMPAGEEPAEAGAEEQALVLASLINKLKTRVDKKQKNADIIKTARAAVVPMATKQPVAPIQVVAKGQRSSVYKDSAEAYRVGKFLQAQLGSEDAQKWCRDNGVRMKTLTAGSDANGGLFVPEEMETAIWDLKREYGVFSQHANVVSMGSDTRKIMKEVSGNSVYFVGEGAAPTASDLVWTQLLLSAKTLAALTKYTKQLSEDSTIAVADEITNWAAHALARREDECGFIGDGTSTYGGMVGASKKYQQILEAAGGTWVTDADKAKLGSAVVATGATWGSIVIGDLISMVGLLPSYGGILPKWHTTSQFYWAVMYTLGINKNGTTGTEVVNGLPTQNFLGYPVIINNVMPAATAVDSVPLLFGDLSASSYKGDRRGITIETSEHADFASRLVSVLVSERFDIINHDFGNYHSSAPSRTAGAMVGLITKAS